MAILGTEGRGSFSCPKAKADGSPKVTTIREISAAQTPVSLSLNYLPRA